MRRLEIGGAEVVGVTLARGIARAIDASGRCRLGVPGGSTPGPVFAWLAANVDPTGIVVTLVDERHVPGDHADSNLRGVRSGLPGWDVVPMTDGRGSLDHARDAFAKGFVELGGLDVVLLGVGPDGHIASLFPGHRALDSEAAVIAISDSPKPPPQRLTLGMSVLEDVDLAVVVARGAAKAPVLARAWARDPALPLGRYEPRGDQIWVLDEAAAAEMP